MWVIILTKYISLNNGKRVYISHNSVHELSIYYRVHGYRELRLYNLTLVNSMYIIGRRRVSSVVLNTQTKHSAVEETQKNKRHENG